VALINAGRQAEAAEELKTVLELDPANVRATQRLEDIQRSGRQ